MVLSCLSLFLFIIIIKLIEHIHDECPFLIFFINFQLAYSLPLLLHDTSRYPKVKPPLPKLLLSSNSSRVSKRDIHFHFRVIFHAEKPLVLHKSDKTQKSYHSHNNQRKMSKLDSYHQRTP